MGNAEMFELARRQAEGMGGRDPVPIFRAMVLCEALGQLREFDGGYVAWLRCSLKNVGVIKSRHLVNILCLGTQELQHGEVLFVAEVYSEKPGAARDACLALTREPGITHWAGWRDKGTRWKLQRIARNGRFPRRKAA